jgi:hypothetical protein
MSKPRPTVDKKCAKCGETKVLSEFYIYKRPQGGIGYTGRCRPCHLVHCKELRDSDHGKTVSLAWRASERGKEVMKNRAARWAAKNKNKYKAGYLLHNAVRDGRLERQPCRICGTPNGEGHHISYDEPLSVDWLCKSCHMDAHYPQRHHEPFQTTE